MQVSEVESREREKVLENMQVSAVCRLFSGLDWLIAPVSTFHVPDSVDIEPERKMEFK